MCLHFLADAARYRPTPSTPQFLDPITEHIHRISGKVSGSAAMLTLSGAAAGSTSTDSSGNYSFSGLPNGSYIVAASQSGYTFSPATASATVNGLQLQA